MINTKRFLVMRSIVAVFCIGTAHRYVVAEQYALPSDEESGRQAPLDPYINYGFVPKQHGQTHEAEAEDFMLSPDAPSDQNARPDSVAYSSDNGDYEPNEEDYRCVEAVLRQCLMAPLKVKIYKCRECSKYFPTKSYFVEHGCNYDNDCDDEGFVQTLDVIDPDDESDYQASSSPVIPQQNLVGIEPASNGLFNEKKMHPIVQLLAHSRKRGRPPKKSRK